MTVCLVHWCYQMEFIKWNMIARKDKLHEP